MSDFEAQERAEARGLDYDLITCLAYNPQEPAFTLDDVAECLAVVEGEKDSTDWHWVLRIEDLAQGYHKFAYLSGGCDYTGWDCQSHADSQVFDTLSALVQTLPERDGRDVPVREPIVQQLNAGYRKKTQSEQIGEELGVKKQDTVLKAQDDIWKLVEAFQKEHPTTLYFKTDPFAAFDIFNKWSK